MEEIKIINADETLFEEITKIVTNSFLSEGVTSRIFNFDKKNSKETLYIFNLLNIKVYYKKGNEILVAIKNNQAVGAALLKKDNKISVIGKIKVYFPKILVLIIPILSMINLKRAFSISKIVKTSIDIEKPYYTLQAIAVDPNHQGQGIGKLLLNKINQIADSAPEFSGIYLFTGDKKNQILYEKFGYETIQECTSKELTVYHMFRKRR